MEDIDVLSSVTRNSSTWALRLAADSHTPAEIIYDRIVASYDGDEKDGERTARGNKYCGTLASGQIALIVTGLEQAGV